MGSRVPAGRHAGPARIQDIRYRILNRNCCIYIGIPHLEGVFTHINKEGGTSQITVHTI